MCLIRLWLSSVNMGDIYSARRFARVLFSLFILAAISPAACPAQTELGSEDDLTVLGVNGTAADPDAEIKGFTVFGSTQTEYTGALVGPGNVVVNGVLAVSSGAYFVGNSTFTGAGKIFITDGSTGQLLRRNAAGYLEWYDASSVGDNLGNHVATTTLNMNGQSIVNAASGTFTQGITASSFTAAGVGLMAAQLRFDAADNIVISSEASAALGGGVRVSTNIYIVGFSSAAKYYGDGSDLTGVASEEALGSKIGGSGTADWVAKFQGSGNAITNSSIYDDGTVVVFTNAASSVTIYGKDAASGYSLVLSSGLNMPAGTLNAGQLRFNSNIAISSEPAAALGGGVRVSTNIYIVGFSSAAKYYGDGSNLTGITAAATAGDSLGTHIATQTLNMASFNLVGVSSVNFLSNVFITSATAAQRGGVYVSTNLFVAGISSAAAYYGDGSALTGLTGLADNLGNHTATTQLKMGNYAVWSSSSITAARYQINGSTVLAMLTGESLGVGINAGRLSTGGYSVFVGSAAGYSHTIGTDNTFVGAGAGYYDSTGGGNSFFGSQAGYNTTAGGNSFVGALTGFDNATGWGNSFLGQAAGAYNSNGQNNSYLGYAAAYRNVTGGGNSILGFQAGFGVAGNSYSSNTLVGYESGFGLTTGSNNIFLGWRAGYSVTTGTGNAVIGYNANTSAPAANNELNIGNLIYGKLDARTIGISTRIPQAALDIVSTGTLASQYAQIWRRGDGVIVGSMSATGVFQAVKLLGDGSGISGLTGLADNLGSHIATTTLNMASFNIVGVSSVNFLSNVFITSATAAQGGGVYISSNVYIVGFSSAARYFGDGSALTGIGGSSGPSIDVSTINATATTPYGGVNITTNTFVQGKLTINGGPGRISNTVGDISIEPAGSNLNVTKNINVAAGQNLGFEGAAGDSYMKYNGGYISVYAEGVEVARFKP